MLTRMGVAGGAKRAAAALAFAHSPPRATGAPLLDQHRAPADACLPGASGQQALPHASALRSFSAGGRRAPPAQQQHGGKAGVAPECGVSFLQHAIGEHELHARLAALWGMPAELLFERQQAVARILGPAGCDTTAHALWVLVRSPQLRHASEATLRSSLRQLHRLVAQPEVDRAAVLTAVYRHPWIVAAMAPQAGSSNGDGDAGSAEAGQPGNSSSSSGGGVQPACATWKQELAAVILDRQASLAAASSSGGGGKGGASSGGGGSWTLSPAFAAAAVRAYVAAAEVAQAVSASAGRLLKMMSLPATAAPQGAAAAAAAAGGVGEQQPCGAPAAPAAGCGGAPPAREPAPAAAQPLPDDASAVGEVLQRLQQQHQQHLLLQQLLAACPPLVALPPELLLARWQRLLSVLQGCGGAAAQLLVSSSYLMLDYDDVEEWRRDAQALRACYA